MKQSAIHQRQRARILFLNRSYWPDSQATGQLLTELCEDLSALFDVSVIAGFPPAAADRRKCPQREMRRGVAIRRVWSTRFGKRTLLLRAVDFMSYMFSATWVALTARRPDVIVVETDPPLLCLLAPWLRRRHANRSIVYLQDIYPEVAVALGKFREGRLTGWLRRRLLAVYRQADAVIVLSRDMRQFLIDLGVAAEKIAVLPNWADTATIVPRKSDNRFREELNADDRLVAMYSGNLGLCQDLDVVIDAAERLRDRPEILFVLVGRGASRARLESRVAQRGLHNVRFVDFQPRQYLAESLSAADVHLVPLDGRVTSYLMPSKIYGILASGTASLVVAPGSCELAQIVEHEQVGQVVEPGNAEALADALVWCSEQRAELEMMGQRARSLAERCYSRTLATERFAGLLQATLSERNVQPAGTLQVPVPTTPSMQTEP